MRAGILTVSDSAFAGRRADASGPAVRARCLALGWQVEFLLVLPDERAQIEARLIEMAEARRVDLILTTGGTGIGPRDTTPEATAAVCEKLLPGLAEHMRAAGLAREPRAVLSRAVAGVRGKTLIVNLPGSPTGAVESLDAVAALLPHAVAVLHGARHD